LIKDNIIIFNPTAGKGFSVKSLPSVHAFFREKQIPYKLISTESVGHAEQIAADHAKNRDTAVIAAGENISHGCGNH